MCIHTFSLSPQCLQCLSLVVRNSALISYCEWRMLSSLRMGYIYSCMFVMYVCEPFHIVAILVLSLIPRSFDLAVEIRSLASILIRNLTCIAAEVRTHVDHASNNVFPYPPHPHVCNIAFQRCFSKHASMQQSCQTVSWSKRLHFDVSLV